MKKGMVTRLLVCMLFIITLFSTSIISVSSINRDTIVNISSLDEESSEKIKVTIIPRDDIGVFRTRTLNEMESYNRRTVMAKSLDLDYEVEYVGKTVNAITLEIAPEQVSELAARGDIAQIIESPDLKIELQKSRVLINATGANPLLVDGINMTGDGQTVCIIDTGVNYTHPDLGGCNSTQMVGNNCSKIIGGYAFFDNATSNRKDIIDNHGHGTHIAGIIAAKGVIQGVAPEAKIVMNKACNSTGSCSSLALVDAVNWCIGNSSAYNISVISISIGDGGNYGTSSACNSADAAYGGLLKEPFAAAVAKNISVVVASGNDGYSNGISWPACLDNATAVGATESASDLLVAYNRGPNMMLVAPGSIINSTGGPFPSSCTRNGNYMSCQGTSMAAPHVSGAIAIINQLLNKTNTTRTPSQIELILNNTGRKRTDITGANYSRINLYDALLNIETISPNVTLTGHVNDTNLTSSTQNFSAEFSDWQLSNATLIIWNSSDIVIYDETVNISGTSNSTSINVSNLTLGSYKWTFNASDSRVNYGSAPLRTFNIPALITILTPSDGYSVTGNAATLDFNFTLDTNTNITNCSLIINSNVTKTLNVTNSSEVQNFTHELSVGNNAWQISCFDLNNSQYLTTSRSIVITLPAPVAASTSSSGGGGGGSSSITYKPAEETLKEGYTNELKVKEKIEFVIFGSNSARHTLTVDAITAEYANITIRSNPIKLTLGVGQSAKVNLTSNEYYDLYVKLDSIEGKKAQFTMQTIREQITQRTIATGNAIGENNVSESNTTIISEEEIPENEFPIQTLVLIIIALMTITAIVVHFIDSKYK